jgi:hypothetical protein
MRLILFLLTAGLLISPLETKAEELNAGIVQGLWYGTPAVFADTPTRIYVALRNNTDRDLTGTVRFTVNEKVIGNAYVSAASGRIVEAWTNWTPSFGEYTVTATLTDVKLSAIGGGSELAVVASTLAEDTIAVDYDTDRDGIGNEQDDDDDNDTIPDIDEIANGTNPLVATPIANEKEAGSSTGSSSSGSGGSRNNTSDTLPSADPTPTAEASYTAGLEQYLPEGRIGSFITELTKKVNETKTTIDTYRVKRKQEVDTYFEGERNEGIETEVASTTSTARETATITRSRIEQEKPSFFAQTVTAGKAIISGFYTLGLWLTSTILGYPAAVELLLLLFIIIFVYKTARRLARRPQGYT